MSMLRPLSILAIGSCAAVIAGCDHVPPAKPTPVLKPGETCPVERVVLPQLYASTRSRVREGWFLLNYDLDGSGQAINISVIETSRPDLIDPGPVEAIRKTSFAPGLTRFGCKALFTFF